MNNLSLKECVRMLSAFIEYANETRKYHDVGNYEYIVRTIKQVDKKISDLEMEIKADDRNVNNLMDQVDSLSKEMTKYREFLEVILHEELPWSMEDLGELLTKEAKDKLISNSIPISKIEAVRNDYMQFLNDCAEDDYDRESSQYIVYVLEKLLTDKDQSNE